MCTTWLVDIRGERPGRDRWEQDAGWTLRLSLPGGRHHLPSSSSSSSLSLFNFILKLLFVSSPFFSWFLNISLWFFFLLFSSSLAVFPARRLLDCKHIELQSTSSTMCVCVCAAACFCWMNNHFLKHLEYPEFIRQKGYASVAQKYVPVCIAESWKSFCPLQKFTTI